MRFRRKVQALPRQADLAPGKDVAGQEKASLPGFYAITGPLAGDGSARPILQQEAGRRWLERFTRLVIGDVSLVQLRVKGLEPDQLEEIIQACLEHSTNRGVSLLLNGPASVALAHGLAGIHLTSKALLQTRQRPLPGKYLVGASCHSPEELLHAERLGCDFACLSPVRATKSYTGSEVLGIERFAQWVSQCSIPVYGLGGLEREDRHEICAAGGQGVAGISAFW